MSGDELEKWVLNFLRSHKGSPRLVTQILHGLRMTNQSVDYVEVGKALRNLKLKGLIVLHRLPLGNSNKWLPCYELSEALKNEA